MTNEKFLNELLSITEKEKNGSLKLDSIKYIDLIEKVKIEIAAEQNKDTTTKQRINFITNFIKKMSNSKPIFKTYSEQIPGFKAFTDTYMMVLLKDLDFNGLNIQNSNDFIKENPNLKYPDITRIIDFKYKSYQNYITLKVNDILNDIKAAGKPKNKYDFDKGIIYKYGENQKIGFGACEMKAFLNFMNFKSSDEITLYFKGSHYPAFTQNKNGSIGLILPIRID